VCGPSRGLGCRTLMNHPPRRAPSPRGTRHNAPRSGRNTSLTNLGTEPELCKVALERVGSPLLGRQSWHSAMDERASASSPAAAPSRRLLRRQEKKSLKRETKRLAVKQRREELATEVMAPSGIVAGPGMERFTSITGPDAGGLCIVHRQEDSPDEVSPVGLRWDAMHLEACPRYIDEIDDAAASAEQRPMLRHCMPYLITFRVRAKPRWVGTPLLKLMAGEFSWRPAAYWKEVADNHLLLLNGEAVDDTTVVTEGSEILHRVWRFEPPVLQKDPRILCATAHVLVVEKPPSLPMHPCGGYMYLTLNRMLECRAPRLGRLWEVHRIDRATGGVVLMARSAQSARWLTDVIQRRCVSKTYIARVRGTFPSAPVSASASSKAKSPPDDAEWPPGPLEARPYLVVDEEVKNSVLARSTWLDMCASPPPVRWVRLPRDEWGTGGTGAHIRASEPLPDEIDAEGYWMIADLPLDVRRQQLDEERAGVKEAGMEAVMVVDGKRGKPSQTLFRRIGEPFVEAGETWSIVAARPLSGRTHQIRAHLYAVGNGIGNDPLYGEPSPLPGAPHRTLVEGSSGVLSPPWEDPRVNSKFSLRAYDPPASMTSHDATRENVLRKECLEAELAGGEAIDRTVAMLTARVGPPKESEPAPKRSKEDAFHLECLAAALKNAPEKLLCTAGTSDPSLQHSGEGIPPLAADATAARELSWYRRFGPLQDFSLSQLGSFGIWLHSVRYRARTGDGGSWEFGCGMPDWACHE
jgi:23S rRNA-/tRNA-specific pseudouridylate synthase